MLNIKLLLLLIAATNLSLMCDHEKSKIVNYSLPISNLAKDKDIPFNLTVAIKTHE